MSIVKAVFASVVLQSNTSVIKLNLSDNWMGSEGAGYISEMLRENCYITDLVSFFFHFTSSFCAVLLCILKKA